MNLISITMLGILENVLLVSAQKNRYCKMDKSHTMCKYPTHSIGANCPAGSKFEELTEREKSQVLRRHNEYRSDVARGDRKRFSCPRGSDILHMEWDSELQRIAERWAMQCITRNDEYRSVDRFDIGQNIFHAVINESYKYSIKTVVKTWNDQYKNMTENIFKGKSFEGCEQFTQIVWSTTSYIGCAKQLWKGDGGQVSQFTVCNYGPRGNILGKSLYTPGIACSKCPPDATSCTTEEDHDGLCTRGNMGTTIVLKIEIMILGLFMLNALTNRWYYSII